MHTKMGSHSKLVQNLPQNICDKPPFSMLLMEINTTFIFQHWKRGEGMLHTFRMIYLVTVVSIYVVGDCRVIYIKITGADPEA